MNISEPLEYLMMPFFIAFSTAWFYLAWFRYDVFLKIEDRLTTDSIFRESRLAFWHTSFGKWMARLVILPFVVVSGVLLYRLTIELVRLLPMR